MRINHSILQRSAIMYHNRCTVKTKSVSREYLQIIIEFLLNEIHFYYFLKLNLVILNYEMFLNRIFYINQIQWNFRFNK